MILLTSTANIRRWLFICDTCKHQVDAYTAAGSEAAAAEHAVLHQVAA